MGAASRHTGNPRATININPTNIASAWNSGNLIVLYRSPTSCFIVGRRCYALVGYNA